MDEVLKSLKMQIKSTRKLIAKENRELQDMSASLNDEVTGFGIKSSVGFMKTNMDHLVEASTKLAQLEETYSMLMYEKKQNKLDCKKGWKAFLFCKKYSKILLKTLYFLRIYDNIYL